MNTRQSYIDLEAGIMILWMIIYHALYNSWSFDLRNYWDVTDLSFLPQGVKALINSDGKLEAINPCILFPYLSFFMPWFFYKSGQFFRKRPWKEQLNKDARKLLRTFVIWSVIGYVMFLAFGMLQHTLTLRSATYSIVRGLFLTGKVPLNEPLWFLLTLFGARLMANLTLPEKDEKYYIAKILILALMGYIVAYLAFRFNHRLLPYWAANGAAGFSFFVLGYGLKEYENKWWLIIPCLLVYIVCCFTGFPMVDMMFNKLIAGHYLLWIPVALCGIVTFNTICRFTCKYISVRPIEIVGENAMIIYVTHILILLTIQFVITYFVITTLYPYMLWMYLAGYIVFLPLLCQFIPCYIKSKNEL